MTAVALVVIGASWGGLFALREVLSALPGDFPVPVVIVQHRRPRDGTGADLAQVLGASCRLPVLEPHDKQRVEAGTVYVAPADYHLLVEPDGFGLSTDERVQHSRPSIDVLLESAADTHGAGTVAVILTGANRDGASGARTVARRGGYVVVQQPSTAENPSMPEAAIAATRVDEILPLDRIGHRLVELATQRDATPWSATR